MKKVVGIFVTDTHLDKSNGELVKSIFDQLLALCKKYNTDTILHGGDVFTNRSGQPLQCLTDWKEILQKINKAGVNLHVIPGNHDKTDSDDYRSYLDVFTDECVHLHRAGGFEVINGAVVGFMPYFKEEKWMVEYDFLIDALSDAVYDIPELKTMNRIFITHIGFDGVKNNDGSAVESELRPSLFCKNWERVLVGHYHNASELTDVVVYPGSAYQSNFGENVTDKGFTVVYEDGTTKFEAAQFPRYIKHEIQATDKESLRNLIEKYDGQTEDHVRFVFTGKKEDCQNINIAEIQGKYGIDCKFAPTETAEAIQISEEDSVLCYDKKTIVKDFVKFCKENGITGDKMKYGLELVKQS